MVSGAVMAAVVMAEVTVEATAEQRAGVETAVEAVRVLGWGEERVEAAKAPGSEGVD
jgi:hypothetical protein